VLIDPVPLPDLSSVDAAIADVEWVLHAASLAATAASPAGVETGSGTPSRGSSNGTGRAPTCSSGALSVTKRQYAARWDNGDGHAAGSDPGTSLGHGRR